MFKSFFIFLILLFLALPLFSLSFNNFSVVPSASSELISYNNASAVNNSLNSNIASVYLQAPVQLSLNKFPISLYALPFFKAYYADNIDNIDKLSFANAFVLINYDDYSLKLGRQFIYNTDTSFAIYFGPDNNTDFSFPSYADGASLSFANDFLAYNLFLAYADFTAAGGFLKLFPLSFLSFSLFSYYKDLQDADIYILGSGLKLQLSQKLDISAFAAINQGEQNYALFNQNFSKNYNASFFKIDANADISSQIFNALLSFSYSTSSKNDKNSLPFTPVSKYNIYGSIAGNIFDAPVQNTSFSLNLSPVDLPKLNIKADAFYYTSAFKDSFSQYIGSEFNLSARYDFNDISLKLSYAYLALDNGFLETNAFANKNNNNNLQRLALSITLNNLF